MKKIFSLICCMFILVPCIAPAYATSEENVIFHNTTLLDNGFTITDEVIEHAQSRSSTKDYTRRRTIRTDDVIVAVISIRGSFRYDGTTVSVLSKSVTQTNTYEGWSYKQNSFTSSGGTITLDAKLTKLLFQTIPFTMTLSCDKDGNISYT